MFRFSLCSLALLSVTIGCHSPSAQRDAGPVDVVDADASDGRAGIRLSNTGALPLAIAIDAPDVVATHVCARVTLTLVDEAGQPTVTPHDAALSAGISAPAQLFSDSQCAQPLTSLAFLAMTYATIAFVRSDTAVAATLDLTLRDGPSAAQAIVFSSDAFLAESLADRTLVIYNANHPDALEIATYYATRRALDSSHLCAVRLPAGQVASAAQLSGARRSIVEDCLCPLLPATVRPSPCGVEEIATIAAHSRITQLALIRGLPPRLYGTPWPSDHEEPSFDYHLAYLLYRAQDIFAPGSDGELRSSYGDAHAAWTDVGAPSPAAHGIVGYARVEAIDKARTLALIDRTIVAERAGFTGNLFHESSPLPSDPYGNYALMSLTESLAPACSDYGAHDPFVFDDPSSSWPASTCRTATTYATAAGALSGYLPGYTNTTIPRVIDAGLLLGANPGLDLHNAFYGFDVMMNWRRSSAPCTALCADLSSTVERASCRAQSTDFFHEINTTCVGVAPGFLGHQLRSWPVQYYGFMPAGWTTDRDGAHEKTAPVVVHGSAYQDAHFTDDAYLHFGAYSLDAPDISMCKLGDGSSAPCPALIPIRLERTSFAAAPLPVSGTRSLTLKLRYRNQAAPGSGVALWLWVGSPSPRPAGQGGAPFYAFSFSTHDAHSTWTESSHSILVDEAALGALPSITSVHLSLFATLPASPVGFVDLDAIEILDDSTGERLIPDGVASFSDETHRQTDPGDWAANVIDRLGAIAWWGSSSHHLTGGFAFYDHARFFGAFFAGRPLAEALAHAGNAAGSTHANAVSGIIYGDSMYRPVAVRAYTSAEPDPIAHSSEPTGARIWQDSGAFPIRVNALLGTEDPADLHWTLESCPHLAPLDCLETDWTRHARGIGPVEGFPVAIDEDLALTTDRNLLLRLRVARASAPQQRLTHFLYLRYRAHDRPMCQGDLDGNGVVDEQDLAIIHTNCTPQTLAADFNHDGTVNISDLNLFLNLFFQGDLRADLNDDGVLDSADVSQMTASFCNPANLAHDLDADGDVDADDIAIVNANLGCPD